MKNQPLSWISGQRMLCVRGRDVAVYVVLGCLAAVSVATGAMASRRVSPASAEAVSAMLGRIQQVQVLPNVLLPDEHGRGAPLLARTKRREAVIVFYGANCESCQSALPRMVKAFGVSGPMLVVVRADEDPSEVRARLDDLGLRDLGFVLDKFEKLERHARVDVLPTMFRIDAEGRVLERIEGLDQHVFERLLRRAAFVNRAHRHKGRPKLRAETAFFQPRDIGVQIRLRLGEVEFVKRRVAFFAHLPRQIVMAVEHEGRAVYANRLVG